MKITEIHVHAGRTFNDPYEQYSNFRPGVTLRATLDEGDQLDAALISLREAAEHEIKETKRILLQEAKNRYEAQQLKFREETDARMQARHLVDKAWETLRGKVSPEEAKEIRQGLAEDDCPF